MPETLMTHIFACSCWENKDNFTQLNVNLILDRVYCIKRWIYRVLMLLCYQAFHFHLLHYSDCTEFHFADVEYRFTFFASRIRTRFQTGAMFTVNFFSSGVRYLHLNSSYLNSRITLSIPWGSAPSRTLSIAMLYYLFNKFWRDITHIMKTLHCTTYILWS